ncbi:MAG: T9SS type A sorting domain-containing protein [Fibrobacteres bacterium]|nr:T9SS type A sorting domain-containing protein [Fibrobacterota bacterium]
MTLFISAILMLCATLVYSSALSDAAGSLKVGEWKEFTSNGYNQNLIMLDVNGVYGSTGCTDWSENLSWDPVSRTVYFLGAGHYRAWKFINYSEATDSWQQNTYLPDSCMYTGGACIMHAYDLATIDTDSGRYYSPRGNSLSQYDIATNKWKTFVMTGLNASFGACMKYFPPRKGFIAIDNGGNILRADQNQGSAWTTVRASLLSGPYYFMGEYSGRAKKLYFGGGGRSQDFYSIDSSLDIEKLPDVPGGLHPSYCSYTTDPVTGNPLLLTDTDTLYSFDTEAKLWIKHSNRKPPFTAHALTVNIPEYGIIMYAVAQGGYKVYLYKHSSAQDTLPLVSLNGYGPDSLEQFLSAPLTAIAEHPGALFDTVTASCAYRSLTPSIADVNGDGIMRSLSIGTAKIEIIKQNGRDTVSVRIVASTAVLDSIRILPKAKGILNGDTFHFHATGYFHKKSEKFSINIDSFANWSVSDPAIASADSGRVKGLSVGGPVIVSATLQSIAGTCSLTVWPKPAIIKRINFQVTTTPYGYGWSIENGQSFSSAKGMGWSGSVTTRDDRNGSSFLLKSFVLGTNATFRIDLPNGNYTLKAAMGDNVYGVNSRNWMTLGSDTVARKDSGEANGITISNFTVTNGSAIFTVNGSLNYLVIISDEGIDINLVADDGLLPPGHVQMEIDEAITAKNQKMVVFPNPFNSTSTLTFNGIPDIATVLSIYDIQGRLVKTLIERPLQKSHNSIKLSGKDFPAGIYMVRFMQKGRKTLETKMMLVK